MQQPTTWFAVVGGRGGDETFGLPLTQLTDTDIQCTFIIKQSKSDLSEICYVNTEHF